MSGFFWLTDAHTEHGEQKTVMIDATYRKFQRTATSMGVKRGAWKP